MEINKKCGCDNKNKRIVFDDPKEEVGFITVACLNCGANYHNYSKNKEDLPIMEKKEFLKYAKKFCKA